MNVRSAAESDHPSSPLVERTQPKKKRQTKKPAVKPSGPIRQTQSRPKSSRSKTERPLTKSGKPTSRVIRVVTPPGFYDPLPVIRPPRRSIATTQQPASAKSSNQIQRAAPYLYQLLVHQLPSVGQIRQHQLHR
ncbi:Hypothetical predicted protein [Mytilus galloprovincialis]|uniref:Uncharacterized protein n=1 Tax=Mytilus galloprovincialis TaxID=29158 RepID=A0A8B6FW79_MYTGA|nr:Hypothetical predicted protein [Mytilus galloprovincialis]